MNKRSAIILTSTVVSLGLLGGSAAMVNNNPKAGADTSPIVTTLDNHETRIKNAENNIKDLQGKTNTAPSTANTPVPTVTQPTVTSSSTDATSNVSVQTDPTPPAPVVVSYREIIIDPGSSDCEYTYSDGSKYQFEWKRTNQQGSWQENGDGSNGHWVATTQTNGFCDTRALGTPKR